MDGTRQRRVVGSFDVASLICNGLGGLVPRLSQVRWHISSTYAAHINMCNYIYIYPINIICMYRIFSILDTYTYIYMYIHSFIHMHMRVIVHSIVIIWPGWPGGTVFVTGVIGVTGWRTLESTWTQPWSRFWDSRRSRMAGLGCPALYVLWIIVNGEVERTGINQLQSGMISKKWPCFCNHTFPWSKRNMNDCDTASHRISGGGGRICVHPGSLSDLEWTCRRRLSLDGRYLPTYWLAKTLLR